MCRGAAGQPPCPASLLAWCWRFQAKIFFFTICNAGPGPVPDSLTVQVRQSDSQSLMHDGWCCKQNALALASPRPHCSRRHVSPATNATAPHTLTHTAHVFQNPAFHHGRKTFSLHCSSSGVTYENEHCAPDGLPARQPGRPSTRPIEFEPPSSSPSAQQDVHDASPQYCLIRLLVSHRGCLLALPLRWPHLADIHPIIHLP